MSVHFVIAMWNGPATESANPIVLQFRRNPDCREEKTEGGDKGRDQSTNKNSKILSIFNTTKSKQKQRDHSVLLFSGQALWVPAGNLHKSASSAANSGVSPLVEQFLVGKTFETFQKMKKKQHRTVIRAPCL